MSEQPDVTPRDLAEHLAAHHDGAQYGAPGGNGFQQKVAHDQAHRQADLGHSHALPVYGPAPRPGQNACCGGVDRHARFCSKRRSA